MESKKLESGLIVVMERPFLGIPESELAAMLVHAKFLAQKAINIEDQESFSAQLLWHTSFNLMEKVELEKANRN